MATNKPTSGGRALSRHFAQLRQAIAEARSPAGRARERAIRNLRRQGFRGNLG